MAHGGKRDNAGRKSKAEEQKLIEKLSPLENTAHKKLKEAIEEGKDWAIKLYFAYMYGQPSQSHELVGDLTVAKIKVIRERSSSNT